MFLGQVLFHKIKIYNYFLQNIFIILQLKVLKNNKTDYIPVPTNIIIFKMLFYILPNVSLKHY